MISKRRILNYAFLYFMIGLVLFLLGLTTYLLVHFFSDIVLYVLISLVISSVIRPVTDYLDRIEVFRIKMPRVLAVFLSFIVLASIPLLFILLIVPLILDQIHIIQTIDYHIITERLRQPVSHIETFVIDNVAPDQKPGFLGLDVDLISVIKDVKLGSILTYLLSFAGKIFIYLLAITFITFFLLYEKGLLRRNILAVIPNAYFEVAVTTIYKIERLLSNYLLGLLGQVSILFTILAIGLGILGVKYALTIAIFAAFINLIPYLGPVLGYLFGIFVVFSTHEIDLTFQYYVFIAIEMLPVFAIAQLTDNLVLQPIIFSKSVKAHPLEIFIIIFVGAAVAGGWGMIAAIPAYTILRVTFIEFRQGYREYRIFRVFDSEKELIRKS